MKAKPVFEIHSSTVLNNAVTGKKLNGGSLCKVGEVLGYDRVGALVVAHACDNNLRGERWFYDKGVLITEWTNPIGATIYIAATEKPEEATA